MNFEQGSHVLLHNIHTLTHLVIVTGPFASPPFFPSFCWWLKLRLSGLLAPPYLLNSSAHGADGSYRSPQHSRHRLSYIPGYAGACDRTFSHLAPYEKHLSKHFSCLVVRSNDPSPFPSITSVFTTVTRRLHFAPRSLFSSFPSIQFPLDLSILRRQAL